MSKKIVFSILLIVVAGAVGARLLTNHDGVFEISASAVELKPITMTVETNGSVGPLSTVEVGCEVSGKIIEINVDHDSTVTKGQILCRIDPELSNAENEQSRADYLKAQSAVADAKLALNELTLNLPVRTQQAEAQVLETRAALTDADYNWHRIEELKKNNNASEAEWVAQKAAWERAQANLTAAEANHQQQVNNEKVLLDRARQTIAQAEAALKLTQARLDLTSARVDRCTIRSPIDGIVLRRNMDVGQTIISAFQTPVIFLLAPSLKTMRVSAKVGESDISHIDVGQTARFKIEAKQSYKFEGKILQRRSQPDIVNNVVTYTVVFEVENPDGILLPGLSVNVVIECVAKESVPVIANAALRFKPPISADERQGAIAAADQQRPPRPTTDANGQPAAYCAEAYAWQFDATTRHWRAIAIWVGITDNVNTEILAGARPGDSFVRKFADKSATNFGLRDAIKLASPENRSL